jgi:hypothetical protein
MSTEEVLYLKLELQQTKGKIAYIDQELAQSRITKHTIEQAIGTASEADFPLNQSSNSGHLPNLNATVRPSFGCGNSWSGQGDTCSDTTDALSASNFNRTIWSNNGGYPGTMAGFQGPPTSFSHSAWVGRGFEQFAEHPVSFALLIGGFRGDHRIPYLEPGMGPPGDRRTNNRINNRFNARNTGGFLYTSSSSSFEGLAPASLGYSSVAGMAGGVAGAMSMGLGNRGTIDYQPQLIGTPLSPFAPEFTLAGGVWKNDVSLQN